ncbi:MAG TPA: hypothetical protein VF281_00735 [Candidatus Saccharimonadales bacterium]
MTEVINAGDAEVFVAYSGRAFVCYYRNVRTCNDVSSYEVEWFFSPDGGQFRKLMHATDTLTSEQRTSNSWDLFCPGVNASGKVTRTGNVVLHDDKEEFQLADVPFDTDNVRPFPSARTISSLWRSSEDTLFCASLLLWNNGSDSSLWLHTGQLGEPMRQIPVKNVTRHWDGKKLVIETQEGILSTTILDVTFWDNDVESIELEELAKNEYRIVGTYSESIELHKKEQLHKPAVTTSSKTNPFSRLISSLRL